MESHVGKRIKMSESEINEENSFTSEKIILDPLLNSSDYAELRNSRMYVDKTMFIKAVLEDNDDMVMISAPRLFCKSTNMNMLRKFVEIELDRNGQRVELQLDDAGFLKEHQPTSRNFNLFKNKKIFTIKSDGKSIFNKKLFTDHFGRYPIVYVDFKNVRGNTYEEILDSLGEAIRNSFLEHMYLKTSTVLSEDTIDTFTKYIKRYESLTALQIKNGLKFLSDIIHQHFRGKNKIYVLIDGFDAPLSNAMSNKSINKVVLQNIIHIIQILIDILLVKNVNIKGVLLNTSNHVGTVLTTRAIHKPFLQNEIYWEFFGFTRNDVIYLLKKVGSLKKFREIEKCYGGYNMKSRICYMDIYCPWSILNYLKTNKIGIFWSVDNFDLLNVLNHEYIRPVIGCLMIDLPVIIPYKCSLDYSDIIALSNTLTKNVIKSHQAHLFFQFLYGNGYLNAERMRGIYMKIKVPNSEIYTQFQSVLERYKNLPRFKTRPEFQN